MKKLLIIGLLPFLLMACNQITSTQSTLPKNTNPDNAYQETVDPSIEPISEQTETTSNESSDTNELFGAEAEIETGL